MKFLKISSRLDSGEPKLRLKTENNVKKIFNKYYVKIDKYYSIGSPSDSILTNPEKYTSLRFRKPTRVLKLLFHTQLSHILDPK
jgi:hypothetical protein